ncbi:MAG: hypothetical protein AB7R89_27795 [Dehalococcoidia bacterium]
MSDQQSEARTEVTHVDERLRVALASVTRRAILSDLATRRAHTCSLSMLTATIGVSPATLARELHALLCQTLITQRFRGGEMWYATAETPEAQRTINQVLAAEHRPDTSPGSITNNQTLSE